MIFHDTVILQTTTVTGTDDWGNDIIDFVDQTVPADIWPLDTDQKLDQGKLTVVQRYQMVISRTATFDLNDPTMRITWQGRQFDVEGAIEQHMIRGRLHHYEAIGKLT
ncbi:phage head completion protein [Gordonia sp. NPDC003429]